jgi:hypothetical protein
MKTKTIAIVIIILILLFVAVVSSGIPSTIYMKIKSQDADKTSGQLSEVGYRNMNISQPSDEYQYVITKPSDTNRTVYRRYYPAECIITIEEFGGRTITGNCNAEDDAIMNQSGY